MSRRFERWVNQFAEQVVRWRYPIVLLTILAAMACGSGARFLGFSNDYKDFFSDTNPQLVEFDKLQAVYTQNDNILFVLAPADGDVFTPENLAVVEEMVEASWQIPYAIRVDAISNFQNSYAIEDDLVVEDLYEDGASLGPADLERIRRLAIGEPLLRDRLINDRAHVTAVNVTLQLKNESMDEIPEAVRFARGIADEIRAAHPGMAVYITGNGPLSNAFSEMSMRDMSTLVPIMYGIMILVMIFTLRSFWGTLATLLVIMLSTITAMGIAGYLGIKITPPSSTAPTMIMTLAVADAIHLLVTMLRDMRAGVAKIDAIKDSIRINFLPIGITSITTAIGFLSMNFSDSPPFHDLGNITAMGVAAAWFFSILFLPAFMAIVPIRAKVKEVAKSSFMDRFADFVVRRERPIFFASVIVILAMIASLPMNELNDEFVNYFDETVPFRVATDFTMDNLTGIYQLEYSLSSGESGGISDPAYLHKLEEFQKWWEAQDGVVQVNSIHTILKRLNKNMHADDESYYRIPDSRELAAQYLLLYEMSLPYGLDLNNQINVDKSATRFVVTLENMSTVKTRDYVERGDQWLVENGLPSMATHGSGAIVMFSYISQRNIKGMLRGTLLAMLLISGILVLALGSWRYGLMSLIPNFVPAIVAFGIWGLFVGKVTMALSTVTAMSLGIVVDDTVHFLTKYLRARRDKGLNAEDAVRYAFSTVGRALLVTSIILVAGFAVLSMSAFDLNAGMGRLTAVAIAVALITDFFFLPVLLIRMERGGKSAAALEPHEITLKAELAGASKGSTKMMRTLLPKLPLFALAGALLLQPVTLQAETPEEKGLAIAIRADATDDGFKNSEATLKMLLKNRHGETSERSMRNKTLEVEGDGDKTLVIFDEPADVKGTAFLTFSHKEGSDDQWLYLPALKRVKRISSSNKSGPFMGSEFAFEDIASQEVEKYTHKFLRDEEFDGKPCHVIEQIPVDTKSGYSRQEVWIDQKDLQRRKVDFYDRKGDLMKTLVWRDYRQYLNKFWRAHEMHMENHQTGKSTTLSWVDYSFQTGLDEGDFNENSLKRAR